VDRYQAVRAACSVLPEWFSRLRRHVSLPAKNAEKNNMEEPSATTAQSGRLTDIRRRLEEVRRVLTEVRQDLVAHEEPPENRRMEPRKRFRAKCRVRHIAPDGSEVRTVEGLTRDISRGGLSFVSTVQVERDTQLAAELMLTEDDIRTVPGKVAYSQLVKKNIYLTGVRFCRVNDPRLGSFDLNADE